MICLGALMRWLTVPGLALHEEFRGFVDLFVKGAGQVVSPRNVVVPMTEGNRRPRNLSGAKRHKPES
jgi:hypothetical protein